MQRVPASSGADAIFEVFQKEGGVIIEGFLNTSEVDNFNTEIQPIMDRTPPCGPSEYGGEAFEDLEFLGRNTKRLQTLVSDSKNFRDVILEKDLMHELCERVFVESFGDGYWFNIAQVIDIGPKNRMQPLHRDQEQYTFWHKMGPSTPEATINFLCAMTPFTEENGATRVVPGSHHWSKFGSFMDPDFKNYPGVETKPAEMKPGDCLFLSGKFLHAGGHNKTATEHRRGLALSIVRHGLMPEQAYPLTIPRDIANTMTYRGQAMFGLRSIWPTTHGSTGNLWSHNYTEIGTSLGLKNNQTKSVAPLS